MTRRYEAVYIFDSTLEDTAIQEKLAHHHGLLNATEEIQVDHWGRRQLAYKIGPRDTGYYVVAKFHCAADVLPEFERALRLDDGVIRYLITLYENEVGAPANLADTDLIAGRRRDDDDDDED